MTLVELLQRIDDGGDFLAVFVSHVQEVDDFAEGSVLEDEHVLRQNFDECEEATLGVVPCVGINLSKLKATFFWMGSRDLMMRLIPNSKLSLEQ